MWTEFNWTLYSSLRSTLRCLLQLFMISPLMKFVIILFSLVLFYLLFLFIINFYRQFFFKMANNFFCVTFIKLFSSFIILEKLFHLLRFSFTLLILLFLSTPVSQSIPDTFFFVRCVHCSVAYITMLRIKHNTDLSRNIKWILV